MGGAQGQVDAEGGAAAGFGFDRDVAVVFFDDAAGGGESQAGAAFFSGEVGVEDMGEVFLGDADAGVGDVEDRVFFFGQRADQEFAAVGHRLYGVQQQVKDGLFEE